MTPQVLFFALVAIGILLIGIEVFIPGGVVGALGFLSLLAAAVVSFTAFGPHGGLVATALLVVVSGGLMAFWLTIFPRTPIGRLLTLSNSTQDYKASHTHEIDLMDHEGEALSDLRPAGIVQLDGQRRDVVAESGWITTGTRVRVVEVEGNRIVVRALDV